MASDYPGRGATVGAGKETVYGTTVARTVWREVILASLQNAIEYEDSQSLFTGAGSTNARDDHIRQDLVRGRVEGEMTYDNWGMFLEQAIGSVSTVNDSPIAGFHTHTFVPAIPFPTALTIMQNRGRDAKDLCAGMFATAWELSVAAGETMRVAFDMLGRSLVRSDTAEAETFASNAVKIRHFHANNATFDGGAYCLNRFRLRCQTGLGLKFCLGDTKPQGRFVVGRQEFTAEAELFVDDDLHTDYQNGDQADFQIVFDDPDSNRQMTAIIQNAKIRSLSDPVNDVGVLRQTVTFKGFAQGTTEDGLSLVLVNENSSAIAN